jgi:soluble lytic murein transglycosylase
LLAQWFTPTQLPPTCEPVFTWAREQNILTPALIEQRVRLILAKGDARFARMVAKPLPASAATPLLQWADLIEQPRREIDALIASPAKKVEPAALLDGWTRLARADLDYALGRYEPLVKARKFEADAASPYALALALRLSWNRHPETVRYFARVQQGDFDEAAFEWRVRAHLWNNDWKGVAAAIAAMPTALRETARWRYWAARAAAQLGDADTARKLYVSVLSFDNYYSAMSAAHLDQAFTPNPVPVSVDEVELRRLSALPGFVRSRELLRAGMRGEAFTEWQVAVRALPAEVQPQTVHLGMRWEWYDVSIATATQQRIFEDYSLLYPRPYDAVVHAAARSSGLPPELVYGVLRQESLYRSDAVSSAGAVGLLQLLPTTARSTARQSNQQAPKREDLFNPAINVPLGAAHLRELRDRFGGQMPIALASYNAGPNAAVRWLPDTPLETDIWIENIPYNETRAYVQRILWHSLVFSWLDSGQPQTTKHWLTYVSRADAEKS